MTINEADKIVKLYGEFLADTYGRLNLLFLNQIPESVLPHPKKTTMIALEVMENYYAKLGEFKGVELIKSTKAILALDFIDDEKALIRMTDILSDEKSRKMIVKTLKDFQPKWLAMQKGV